jgi:hypothetical protein
MKTNSDTEAGTTIKKLEQVIMASTCLNIQSS